MKDFTKALKSQKSLTVTGQFLIGDNSPWADTGINYLIEIYPTFNDKANIAGWNLYAAAHYDLQKKRYYLKKHFAENKTIDEIANNAEILISESYQI